MPVPWKHARNGFRDVDLAWKQLTKISNDLKLSQRLTKGQSNRFTRVTSQAKNPLSPAAQKHYRFLNRVREIDPNYYMLCTIAFTQYQIDSTRVTILKELVKRIKDRRGDATVIHGGIRSLVADL